LFSTNDSAQVALPDVFREQILSFRPEYERVTLQSVRYTARILAFLFGLSLNVALSETATALDWPDGYVAYENTASPDGRYGVIVPTMEVWEKDESLSEANYLADLKNHRVLGKIAKVDYFEHQNHRGLKVFWAPQSGICVVENDGRYGADSISVLEINASSFAQTEIGDRIQKSLDGAMKKQAHTEMGGYVSPYFRFGTDRKIRVRVLSQNNPKQFDDVKTYYALFQGTFDVGAKKFTVTDARSISAEQDDALETAYSDLEQDLEHTTFQNEEDKAESLDQTMNKVYHAAQFILPPARFAAVKIEQIEWLKKRNAAPSTDEKCKLVQARIKALQELVW
jgi:uncharacterized protein YecT (DUF1311 family)